MAVNFDAYKLWSLTSIGIAFAMLHNDGRLALFIGSLMTYFVFNLLSSILGDNSFQSFTQLKHNYMEKFKVKEGGLYKYNTFAGDCIEAAASMILSKICVQAYLHNQAWNTFVFDWKDLKVGLMVVCLFVVPVYHLFFKFILPNCPRFLQSDESKLVQLFIFNPLFNFILSIFAFWCLNMYYNPGNESGISFDLWSMSGNSPKGAKIELTQAIADSKSLWWDKPMEIFGAEKYIIEFFKQTFDIKLSIKGQFISWAFWMVVWISPIPPINYYFFVGFVWNIIFDLVILGKYTPKK